MTTSRAGHPALSALVIGATISVLLTVPAGAATTTRTSGNGEFLSVSWTEYDSDDLLGLPGNVHIGYLYAENSPYGSYINGWVSDFDCEEGESPWGGGHDIVEEAAEQGAEAATEAAEDAIEEMIDSGQATIDAAVVAAAVEAEVLAETNDTITDHFEEFPTCDYIQDRYLDGTGTATLVVDSRRKEARVTGTLTVSHGGHGEPGEVLGAPPIELTITGGDWNKFEYSSSSKSQSYSYRYWQAGTGYDGGTVSGRIGAMNFADDADDEAYGNFNHYKFRTVDRIR